jgi:isoquinoline 1-oxidoreductase alpha subunit
MEMNLKINGENRTFDAPGDVPLLWVLRDVLGMTGTERPPKCLATLSI